MATLEKIKIRNRWVGSECPPFIIAEMSGNHNQSLETALGIVEAAAKAGAHALKLQTYTADTMTLDSSKGDFLIKDPASLWKGQTLYELYQKAATPWEWHKPLFERAQELGMLAFSTPFDATAVDFLQTLEVPCYKIASFENTDLALIRKAVSTGKPVIISTGLASKAELEISVAAAREAGCKDLILLKCVSDYPCQAEDANLRTMADMRETFQCPVGLSDHSRGIGVSVAAVALGASIIEKHFTLSRAEGGVDAAFSMEPDEMKSLVREAGKASQARGKVYYGPMPHEEKSLKFRRSLYVNKDLKKGDRINSESIRAIRPGEGLSPIYLDKILGRLVIQDVKKGTPVQWELFSEKEGS